MINTAEREVDKMWSHPILSFKKAAMVTTTVMAIPIEARNQVCM